MKLLVRWLVTAIAVAVAVWIVPGITTFGGANSMAISIAVTALALALINMFVKPVVVFLSCPLTILTLGLFYLVINALMLELAAWASSGLLGMGISIDGFGSAFLGSIIISIVSMIVNGLVGGNDQANGNNRR